MSFRCPYLISEYVGLRPNSAPNSSLLLMQTLRGSGDTPSDETSDTHLEGQDWVSGSQLCPCGLLKAYGMWTSIKEFSLSLSPSHTLSLQNVCVYIYINSTRKIGILGSNACIPHMSLLLIYRIPINIYTFTLYYCIFYLSIFLTCHDIYQKIKHVTVK